MRLRTLMYVMTIVCCWGETSTMPQHILNELKANVLQLFGLKERPKFNETPHIPEALQKLYEDATNLDFDTASLPVPGLHTRSANTIRSFVHIESPVDEKFVTRHKFRLKFDVSSIPKHETLKAAEIKLTRVSVPGSKTLYYRVLVHDILRRGIKGVRPPTMRLIDSKILDIRANTTISLDLSPAVHRWMSDPKSNYGVLIALHAPTSHDKKGQRHLRLKRDTELDEDWWQKRPLLFTYTDDGKNRQMTKSEMARIRPKRGARKAKNSKEPCQRRHMYVDFRDLGWNDWIFSPQGYNAYYCTGHCYYPMPQHLNATNHAIIQSLVNSMKPIQVPKPCCVPTELSAISMLYVGSDGNVVLKNYKDMVVEACGCR